MYAERGQLSRDLRDAAKARRIRRRRSTERFRQPARHAGNAGTISESIRDSLKKGGLSAEQADNEAASRTKDLMSKLAALHEPDMVAGGWTHPDPKGMGRADVNSSIGSSWNQDGRVASMDASADDAIKKGRVNEKMNVKLEPCRGKGLT